MIKIDKILDRLINSEEFNPFNDKFSPSKIKNFLDSLNESDEFDIKNVGTISGTYYINLYYRSIVERCQNVITESEMSYDEAQRFLIASVNRISVIKLLDLKKHLDKSGSDNGEVIFEDMIGYKIVSADSEIELSSISSQIIESINHSQKIISRLIFAPSRLSSDIPKFGYFFEVFQAGNYTYILKDIYDAAIWEGGYLLCDINPPSITLKFHDPMISYVKRIGELRLQRVISSQLSLIISNDMLRSTLYKFYYSFKRGKCISIIEVNNGEMIVEVQDLREGENSPFPFYLSYFASMTTFYPFIKDIGMKLYNFSDLNLNDVYVLLTEISYLLNNAVAFSAVKQQDIEDIETDLEKYVFRIKEKVLCDSLLQATVYSSVQIKTFLNSFTLINIETSNYWRNPIIKENDYYIFIVEPLTSQNKIYLIDYILQKGNIKMENRGPDLEKYVKEDIDDSLKNKNYSYKIIQQKNFKVPKFGSEEIDLILVTKHTIVIAEIKCISSVVDSRSLFNAQKQINKAIQQIKRKSQFVIDNINVFEGAIGEISGKDVLNIVITNLPNFTGLVYNGVPTIDIVALNNYFSMGSLSLYLQGSVITYYKNEEEFSRNIREYMTNPPVVWSLADRFKQYIKRLTPDNFKLNIYAEVVEAVGDTVK